MKYALIAAPFLFALALMFGAGVELFWPFLLLAAAITSWWNWRVALVLLVGCIAVQIPKAEVIPLHQWVYWAAIYIALGVFSLWLFDTLAGVVALIVGGLFLTYFAGVPDDVAYSLTELAFMVGLLVAGYRGDGGVRAVLRPSPGPAKRRGLACGHSLRGADNR